MCQICQLNFENTSNAPMMWYCEEAKAPAALTMDIGLTVLEGEDLYPSKQHAWTEAYQYYLILLSADQLSLKMTEDEFIQKLRCHWKALELSNGVFSRKIDEPKSEPRFRVNFHYRDISENETSKKLSIWERLMSFIGFTKIETIDVGDVLRTNKKNKQSEEILKNFFN